jgi:dihydrofolate synthase/folylpolyglutamate synthase
MTYPEAVDYLFSQLPMFQRIGAAAYKSDLSNTIAICESLGNPQHKFKSVHIAGTNGKGSVSSTLASIFAVSGYKTGLFTSPHLKDFRERIRINGNMIPESAVVHFLEKYIATLPHLKPSFFELTCCMAFEYFAQEEVDIAILETGMGGRLDSTNVVTPELSIITSISLDHQQFLGDTISKIAAEKGGIIKPGIPVVISENEAEAAAVLITQSLSANAPVTEVTAGDIGLQTDLGGIYQQENMRTVRKAVEVLRALGWSLPENSVVRGARNVIKKTGLRGRWEMLSEQPKIIADVGHNEEGVKMVVEMLADQKYDRLHIVWGMVGDKDSAAILSLLPADAIYYWCKPDIPRGKEVDTLKKEGQTFGLEGKSYTTVSEALAAAMEQATPADLIFTGGSVFVVGEILASIEVQ